MINWLRTWRNLKASGVLGMNRRNANFITSLNPRELYPLVDDKIKLAQICDRHQIPTPKIESVIEHFGDLKSLGQRLSPFSECVIKPARGGGGRGILVITAKNRMGFQIAQTYYMPLAGVSRHIAEILSGTYSFGDHTDQAIIQRRIHLHPAFEKLSYRGIPDIRVIVYKHEPIMAMLRVATMESSGKANLHQGGIGIGINLSTGKTIHAIQKGRIIDLHPDTGEYLPNREIPHWSDILALAVRVTRVIGLGYVGIDIVLEPDEGPMLLEANVRPGLAIQLANGEGLMTQIQKVDQDLKRRSSHP